MQVILNIAALFYIIIGLTVLIDGYLILCLNKVANQKHIPKKTLAFVWALCLAIPETTTNTISTFFSKKEMEGFGFGLIIGSGIYDFTFAFGIACLASSIVHKRQKRPDAQVEASSVYPTIGLYIGVGSYISFLTSLPVVDWKYPLSIILTLPLSYLTLAVTQHNEEHLPIEEVDCLERAWEQMQSQDILNRRKKSMRKDSKEIKIVKEISLAEIYEARVKMATGALNGVNERGSYLPSTNGVPSNSNIISEEEDEETFFFVPRNHERDLAYAQKNLQIHKAKENSNHHQAKYHDHHNQDKKLKENAEDSESSFIDSVWASLALPWEFLFGALLPHNKFPGLSFIMIIGCCFCISDIQLSLAESIIGYFKLDANFVAMTIYNLFSNMPDLLTVVTAARKDELALAVATVFSSQLINLQVALSLPWFMRTLLTGPYSIAKESGLSEAMAVVVVVLVLLAVGLWASQQRLTLCLGVYLLTIYLSFVIFQYASTPGGASFLKTMITALSSTTFN